MFAIDLRPIFHEHWTEAVRQAVMTHGRHVVKQGRGYGSLEEEDRAGLDYCVLTGSDVMEYLPWLYDLYTGSLLSHVTALLAMNVYLPDDLDGSINVNLLRGRGARYEWHVDRQRWTMNLFATTHTEADGGALLLRRSRKAKKVETIYPEAGCALLFDGAHCPHAVEALKTDTYRITIPMTYFTEPAVLIPGLNDYLFSEQP